MNKTEFKTLKDKIEQNRQLFKIQDAPMSRSSISSCSSVLSLDGDVIGYRLACWNCKTIKTRKSRFSSKERRTFASMHA